VPSQFIHALFLQACAKLLSVFFLTGIALYKINIFPEVLGFGVFFFVFQKFSQGPYPRKRRNKEKCNNQTLRSSSKPNYYKGNESDLLLSLNFHVAVVDFIQFTASIHRVHCSTWT